MIIKVHPATTTNKKDGRVIKGYAAIGYIDDVANGVIGFWQSTDECNGEELQHSIALALEFILSGQRQYQELVGNAEENNENRSALDKPSSFRSRFH